MTPEKLGARLRARRTELGLKQEELTEKSGIRQSAISAYELGNNYPPLKSLLRMAAALETTVTELLREEEM